MTPTEAPCPARRRPWRLAAAILLLGLGAGAPVARAAEAAANAPAAPMQAMTPAARRAVFLARLTLHAEAAGIPPALADAVAMVESGYDPNATGADGEVGMMQILPSTAALLGHRAGRDALFDPDTNMRLAIAYLVGAWRLGEGNVCRALARYRAGHGETRITPLSVEYCRRALAHLGTIGSPLATGPGAAVPPADAPGASSAGPVRGVVRLTSAERVRLRTGQRTEADSQRYWAAHEARIQAIRARASMTRQRRSG